MQTHPLADDPISQAYLDDLTAYAKAHPRITEGMQVAVHDENDTFQAYGRVLKTEWNGDNHIASILLYGGTVCALPEYRLEQVKWPA